MHYQGQVEAIARLIKQLKDEKSKMGLGRIRDIVLTWWNRTKWLVEEISVQWWSKWAKQAGELQVLHAGAENRRKEADDFYKMDTKSVVTLREELSDDLLTLAGEQLVVVGRLVE